MTDLRKRGKGLFSEVSDVVDPRQMKYHEFKP